MAAQSPLLPTTTLLGITATLVHSGVSLAASQLVIPSITYLPPAEATSVFIPFYHLGARIVVPLAAISGISLGVSSHLTSEKRYGYATAAGLAIASIPWTLTVMMPTNTRLVEIGSKRGEEKFAGEALQLLGRWSLFNAFRASAAFVGGVVGLVTYAGLV